MPSKVLAVELADWLLAACMVSVSWLQEALSCEAVSVRLAIATDVIDADVVSAPGTELVEGAIAATVVLQEDEPEEPGELSSDSLDADGSVEEGETVHMGTMTPVAGSYENTWEEWSVMTCEQG